MIDQSVDSDIVSKYFSEYIRRGFKNIFAEQRNIAAKKIYGRQAFRADGKPNSRSGILQKALDSPNLLIDDSNQTFSASVEYPTFIRFLDMKRLGNYRIYNRPIWGILYRQTFRDIRYEFREWLEKFAHNTITNSYNQ